MAADDDPRRAGPVRGWAARHGLLAAAVILAILLTRPFYMADTSVYVSQALRYYGASPIAPNSLLWEFGHLLWRPLGWLLIEIGAPLLGGLFHSNLALACTAIFISINLAAGLLTVLMWHSLLLELGVGRAVAFAVALTFACANAFLNYAQSGSSYVMGLFLLTSSMWMLRRGIRRGGISPALAWAAGATLAAAVMFWFPYVLSVPGVLFIGLRRPADKPMPGGALRQYLRLGLHFIAAFACVIALCCGLALAARRAGSVAEAKAWVEDASHGWSQTNNIVRIATGLPRSFLYFGKDGILYKRFLWKDPYAPVKWRNLLPSAWKLVLFYLFAAALLFELARVRANHWMLWTVLIGVAPTLAFAVFMFEPGSPERYFPMYPFVVLGVGQALAGFPRPLRIPQALIALFAVCLVAINVSSMYRPRISAEDRPAAERLAALKARVGERDFISVLTDQDDACLFENRAPFDPQNRPDELLLYDVIQPAMTRLPRWRADFAERALKTWNEGGSVWVSRRMWAARPLPDWNWTEGDDRRIAWPEVPQFFRGLEISGETVGTDGFFRLAATENNRARLREFAADPARTTLQ